MNLRKTTMHTWRWPPVLMAAAALSACAVGQNYRRPVITTPQAFRFADSEAQNLADTAWWRQFKDPVLNELIDTALTQNKDIRIAAARVQEFAANLMSSRSGYFPQLNYTGLAGRSRTGTQPVV